MIGTHKLRKLVLGLFLFLTLSNQAARIQPAPTGVLTLALLNSRFPVKEAYDVIKESPHPAFAFVHKVFGNHYEHLEYLIAHLASTHDSISVLVYADCGPCRFPRRPIGLFPVIAPHENIVSLNRKLEKGNTRTLALFSKEFMTIKSNLPTKPGVSYNLQIGLEDNYTTNAHKVLRALALQLFADRPDVTIGRNALKFQQAPYPVEMHTYDINALSKLKPGDILTGDGFTLTFPKDPVCLSRKFDDIRKIVIAAREQAKAFFVYRSDIQGIPICFKGTTSISPSKRIYKISQKDSLKRLIK